MKKDRREFLRTIGRWGAFGALLTGGVLVARRGGTLRGQTCRNKSVCRGCPSYDGCRLPAAATRKQASLEAEF